MRLPRLRINRRLSRVLFSSSLQGPYSLECLKYRFRFLATKFCLFRSPLDANNLVRRRLSFQALRRDVKCFLCGCILSLSASKRLRILMIKNLVFIIKFNYFFSFNCFLSEDFVFIKLIFL